MEAKQINNYLKKMLGWGALLFLIYLATGAPGWCTTYHVSPGGNDANDGREGRPFKTLAVAAARIQPGDMVLIGEGTYAEMLEITRAGTAEAPIVFQAAEGADVHIDASGLRHGVIIWDADYIVVRSLVVENSLRSGIHLHDHLDDDDHGADFNRIEGNTVRQCGSEGYSGIYTGGHGNQVIDNLVVGNGFKPGDAAGSGHGIYVLGNDNRVSGNTVRGNARVGIRLEGERNRFENNLIEDNQDFGVTIWVDAPLKGEDLAVSGNILRNNQRGGISVYGQGDGQKPQHIRISGNTISNSDGEYGVRVLDGCRDVHILDNMFQGKYRTAVLYVDEASLKAFEENRSQIEAQGAFYLRNTFYSTYEAYKKAYLVDPVGLRKVP